MTTTLKFTLSNKAILSSNTYKSLHWAVKGKLTESLRSLAVEEGSKFHEEKNQPLLEQRLDALREIANQSVRKARRTKALQKQGDLTAAQIKATVEEEFSDEELVNPDSIAMPRLFNHFKVRVIVAPPTRRRLDPVNLYPTVKAIIDGLTDAAWWEDDDFTHLLELSFVYGGLSGEKNTFHLTLEVTEVEGEDLEFYNRISEVAAK